MERHFTTPGIHPYDEVEWETRDALIPGPSPDSSPTFEQRGVEFPSFWSQTASNIVAQKYFAYNMDDPRRERSLRQLIDRVVGAIAQAGSREGYFSQEEEEIFRAELTHILLHQLASFNSPVWFNLGVEDVPQVASACYILAVDDDLRSILNWYVEEGIIFQAGSGAGVNLSRLRGAGETLSRGGRASGPVTFMRAADANAGTITSGGRTRRAAKLVCLDVDHPDIEDFVLCKTREEERARALAAAGFDMSLNTPAGERNWAESTSYQNANNSVRLTDEFMRAVEVDGDWELIGRANAEPTKTVKARALLHLIAESAWRCADPGIQYASTINHWHTTPAQGPIRASNPCSEFVSNDNSSCNLASLNLLRFLRRDGSFDIAGFRHTVRLLFTAQEITIAFADFPTEAIAANTRGLRQIGIGYANLGALLMALGLAYDSDEARSWAALVTALLTGEAYLQSTRLAERVGSFPFYHENADSIQRVIRRHRAAVRTLRWADRELGRVIRDVWAELVRRVDAYGVRNAQASALAPTGTISFMLDCDTTGIEPDFSLVKLKRLAGGGEIRIVNQTVPRALGVLGYAPVEIDAIVSYIREQGYALGAPGLRDEHLAVFDCAVGPRAIDYRGHLKMMAAVQPLLSGAISKTTNVPEDASVDEIERIFIEGWQLGLKAVTVYRDGSKTVQPLSSDSKSGRDQNVQEAVAERLTSLLGDGLLRGERRRVPNDSRVVRRHFRVAEISGYIHVGLFPDGTPGDIFVTVAQAGSTLRGIIDSWALTLSLALQYGTPLDALVSKLSFTDFEPRGFTNDMEIRTAKSIVDYVMRWLAKEFLDPSAHALLGIRTAESSRADTPEQSVVEITGATEFSPRIEVDAQTVSRRETTTTLALNAASLGHGICSRCSGTLRQAGACLVCESCGETTGCG